MKYAWIFVFLPILISVGPSHVQAQRVYRIGAPVAGDPAWPDIQGFKAKTSDLERFESKGALSDPGDGG